MALKGEGKSPKGVLRWKSTTFEWILRVQKHKQPRCLHELQNRNRLGSKEGWRVPNSLPKVDDRAWRRKENKFWERRRISTKTLRNWKIMVW